MLVDGLTTDVANGRLQLMP